MRELTIGLISGLLALHCYIAAADDAVHLEFTGEGNGRTEVFQADGPWLLDWRVSSDAPLLAVFEMRLHDARSGEYEGTLIELHGTGNGLKLFEEGGSFEIGIVARNASWELEVFEVSAETAAQLRRLNADEPTMQDKTRTALQHLHANSFKEWRPEGDRALLLFDGNGPGWRATFMRPCIGLESATAISFVTPIAGSLDEYDSILLDNGSRCYFERVVPTLVE